MQVQVYLFFAGRCEEAVEFYKKTMGLRSSCLCVSKTALNHHNPE